MVEFARLDERIALVDQFEESLGPVVLVNLFTVDPDDADGLLAAWARDADFMRRQPGFISAQLHRGIGGSSTFLNYAVWENVESFKTAFRLPEFQRQIAGYPESTVARPLLFQKLTVPGICTGD